MQYEIFRDLLMVLITAGAGLAALLGGLVFFVLRAILVKDISAEVDRRVDKELRKLRGQSDLQTGVTYWIQRMYDRAIDVTRRAITEAGDVLDESQRIFAKSNLGFYYAEKHRQQPSWQLKSEAIELTRTGYEKYSASDLAFAQPDWISNYLFVRSAFIQSIQERDEVIQVIDGLLKREDLKPVHGYLQESKEYALALQLTS